MYLKTFKILTVRLIFKGLSYLEKKKKKNPKTVYLCMKKILEYELTLRARWKQDSVSVSKQKCWEAMRKNY